MIKNVYSSGPYLTAHNNNASNYVNNFSGAQGLGNMRFNTTTQIIEVYDGQMWQPFRMSDIDVSLTPDAVDAIGWVNQKRVEELAMEALASTNTAVKIALDNLKKAKEQLDVTIILSKEHNESTS